MKKQRSERTRGLLNQYGGMKVWIANVIQKLDVTQERENLGYQGTQGHSKYSLLSISKILLWMQLLKSSTISCLVEVSVEEI